MIKSEITELKITIFWSLLYLFSQFCLYYSIKTEFFPQEIQSCGVIVEKKTSNDLSIHKHSADLNVEEFFLIKYDNGKLEKRNCTSEDYFSKNVGDRVCYTDRVWNSSFTYFLILLSGIVGIAVDAIVIVMLLVCTYRWLIADKGFTLTDD